MKKLYQTLTTALAGLTLLTAVGCTENVNPNTRNLESQLSNLRAENSALRERLDSRTKQLVKERAFYKVLEEKYLELRKTNNLQEKCIRAYVDVIETLIKIEREGRLRSEEELEKLREEFYEHLSIMISRPPENPPKI